MGAALARDTTLGSRLKDIMVDLRPLVLRLQRPRPADESWSHSICRGCEELAQRISDTRRAIADRQKASSRSLKQIADTLRDYSRELTSHPEVQRLQALYQSLARSYEELRLHLRDMEAAGLVRPSLVDQLTPVNYARNAFHAGMGLFAVLMYEFVITYTQALIILFALNVVFFSLEIARRLSPRLNGMLVDRVFSSFARPSERHRINSSSYYLLSMTFVAILFPQAPVQLAVLILAFADPAATVAGKLWGRKKLIRNKSWVGTASFFAVAFVVTTVFLLLKAPHLTLPLTLLASLTVSAIGAATELLSYRIDDNLSIPILVVVAAHLLI
ncbi:MAG: diacylglycerol/polyprenol kinase family protein [Pseudomonadota bacterium]